MKRRVNLCVIDAQNAEGNDIELMLAAAGVKAIVYRPESYRIEDCDWGMQQRIPQYGLAGACDISVVEKFDESQIDMIISSQAVATEDPMVVQLCDHNGIKRLSGKELVTYCRKLLSE